MEDREACARNDGDAVTPPRAEFVEKAKALFMETREQGPGSLDVAALLESVAAPLERQIADLKTHTAGLCAGFESRIAEKDRRIGELTELLDDALRLIKSWREFNKPPAAQPAEAGVSTRDPAVDHRFIERYCKYVHCDGKDPLHRQCP